MFNITTPLTLILRNSCLHNRHLRSPQNPLAVLNIIGPSSSSHWLHQTTGAALYSHLIPQYSQIQPFRNCLHMFINIQSHSLTASFNTKVKLTSATCAVKLTSFVKIGGELSNGHLKIPSETRKTALKISPLISEFLRKDSTLQTGVNGGRDVLHFTLLQYWRLVYQTFNTTYNHPSMTFAVTK